MTSVSSGSPRRCAMRSDARLFRCYLGSMVFGTLSDIGFAPVPLRGRAKNDQYQDQQENFMDVSLVAAREGMPRLSGRNVPKEGGDSDGSGLGHRAGFVEHGKSVRRIPHHQSGRPRHGAFDQPVDCGKPPRAAMGDRTRGTGSQLSLHPSDCLTGQTSSGSQRAPRGCNEIPQVPGTNNRPFKISNSGADLL
jgi:hypothetical protein